MTIVMSVCVYLTAEVQQAAKNNPIYDTCEAALYEVTERTENRLWSTRVLSGLKSFFQKSLCGFIYSSNLSASHT